MQMCNNSISRDNQQPSLEFKSSLKVQRLGIETMKIEYNIPTSAQHPIRMKI